MSNFGDDLIQSLGEAVAHAKGDGPGTEHAPANTHILNAVDILERADDANDEAD